MPANLEKTQTYEGGHLIPDRERQNIDKALMNRTELFFYQEQLIVEPDGRTGSRLEVIGRQTGRFNRFDRLDAVLAYLEERGCDTARINGVDRQVWLDGPYKDGLGDWMAGDDTTTTVEVHQGGKLWRLFINDKHGAQGIELSPVYVDDVDGTEVRELQKKKAVRWVRELSDARPAGREGVLATQDNETFQFPVFDIEVGDLATGCGLSSADDTVFKEFRINPQSTINYFVTEDHGKLIGLRRKNTDVQAISWLHPQKVRAWAEQEKYFPRHIQGRVYGILAGMGMRDSIDLKPESVLKDDFTTQEEYERVVPELIRTYCFILKETLPEPVVTVIRDKGLFDRWQGMYRRDESVHESENSVLYRVLGLGGVEWSVGVVSNKIVLERYPVSG